MTNSKYNIEAKREHKGKSLLNTPKDFTIIDVETTAFNYFYGDIIEVGAIKVRDNVIIDKYSELIKIVDTLPPYITEITGITDDMLLNARGSSNVICDFLDFIGNDILVAHNANFDVNFLYDLCSDLNLQPFTNDFVDTLRLSRKIHKNFKNHKLETLCKHYSVERKEHRSLSDCLSTYEVYMNMFKCIVENQDSILKIQTQQNRSYNDLKKIEATENEIDESNYFYNKSICFTGKMDYLTKKEAAQLTVNLGANPVNDLTTSTDILVLGNLEFQHSVYGDKSNKHKKAEKLLSNGFEIEILTENDFLEIIEQCNPNFG